ncbi:hypothetical protein TCAL_01108 [Tigriopus californicus]|uniref:sphingomyelin phosphodiesterase n=1 Tax=Tigriopus californicus TaxID=6832 RepID=A0A553P390_TIGCA|nr:putative neutral sphingomyelinase [Tigriopus californicus]TRY72102.1 hypothetical protein TCAL_01108 [Tigriopus californicus]|eukprot:TCALIF_01108-PA protein Name:"Similar to CG12034 Putative neutral sphingomyelinase (Drosophila melanogaster)" AED:0.00 eAED:0.00 QI:939/1/1/1/1/1/2/322/420
MPRMRPYYQAWDTSSQRALKLILGLVLLLSVIPVLFADEWHPYPRKADIYWESKKLKILNLNAWGLSWPWSLDRRDRFLALREIIALSDYDIILLQEVWFKEDYNVLRHTLPFVTFFESFNVDCSGFLIPMGCSGLMILSRHPIEEVDFKPFSKRGSFWNFDGEIFVSKGVGRARVRWEGLSVDVFTTHFVSYTNNPNNDNSNYRFTQALEAAQYVERSNADIKLFGGDLNALPLRGRKQPYSILRRVLKDSLLDIHPETSFHSWFATFGNIRNTYTREAFPERIDYLMFTSNERHVKMRTSEFTMPMFMTRNQKNELVSLSDHEALHVIFDVQMATQAVGYNGRLSNAIDDDDDDDDDSHAYFDHRPLRSEEQRSSTNLSTLRHASELGPDQSYHDHPNRPQQENNFKMNLTQIVGDYK